MNANVISILKKIATLGRNVIIITNKDLGLTFYYIVQSFTPPQGQIQSFQLEGYDITSLIESETLFTNFSFNVAISNNDFNDLILTQHLETKLLEIKISEMRLSQDWSYCWFIK